MKPMSCDICGELKDFGLDEGKNDIRDTICDDCEKKSNYTKDPKSLQGALFTNRVAMVRKVLESKANVNDDTEPTARGVPNYHPMDYAIHHEHCHKMLRVLCDSGFDFKKHTFFWRSWRGDLKTLRFLLAYGANPIGAAERIIENRFTDPYTEIDYKSNIELVEKYLKRSIAEGDGMHIKEHCESQRKYLMSLPIVKPCP